MKDPRNYIIGLLLSLCGWAMLEVYHDIKHDLATGLDQSRQNFIAISDLSARIADFERGE